MSDDDDLIMARERCRVQPDVSQRRNDTICHDVPCVLSSPTLPPLSIYDLQLLLLSERSNRRSSYGLIQSWYQVNNKQQ